MQYRITAEKNTYSKSNHIEMQKDIEYLENLFTNSNVKINSQSDLFKLLKDVKENFSEINTEATMVQVLYVSRIISAIKCLENFDDRKNYLYDLLNGSLDVLEHKPSRAKSILFELETLTHMQSFFKDSYLDEPDVVVPIDEYLVGVSCKKITSEKNLQSALSKGVKQIEMNSFEYGIVAINIDDLVPEKALLKANSSSEVLEILYKYNVNFIEKHKRHFLKYINDSRIFAVMVSTSIFADVESATPRFNTAFQRTAWTITNLNEEQKKILNSFKKLAH